MSNLQWQAYPPLLNQTAPLTEAAPTQRHTHTAKQLEVNHCDRQIEQGAGVKMQRVGISFVCCSAGLPNWLIKLE